MRLRIYSITFSECVLITTSIKGSIQYFYAGLLPSYNGLMDSSSNGFLYTKIFDKALELFERVSTSTAMCTSEQVVCKKAQKVYEMDTYMELSAKIDTLVHKVESIS